MDLTQQIFQNTQTRKKKTWISHNRSSKTLKHERKTWSVKAQLVSHFTPHPLMEHILLWWLVLECNREPNNKKQKQNKKQKGQITTVVLSEL